MCLQAVTDSGERMGTLEEGVELVMDRDQELEAARDTTVEPTAGEVRVELWLNVQAEL